MRNEGPFILEWLAWHRAIGFEDVLVLSNACTDGSDTLLDALAARGYLTHLRHDPAEGSFALRSAYRVARKSLQFAKADWVMALDADEFLVVHVGQGRVQDLLAHHQFRPLGIAVHWKCFGDNNHAAWVPGLVRHQFTACALAQDKANMRFKSIFRDPSEFVELSSHTPNVYQGAWGGDNIWVTSDGRPLRRVDLTGLERVHATAMRRITHDIAQVNHYAIKARECLQERRAKWSSSQRDGRYGDAFIERYNKNDAQDNSALALESRFEQAYAPLINDPEIAALHQRCCNAYRAALDHALA